MVQTEITNTDELPILGFPKLMISKHDNSVILFKKQGCGTVLKSGAHFSLIGYYSDNWDMHSFKDFYEAITLQNELP
jgi:hypothetical protein